MHVRCLKLILRFNLNDRVNGSPRHFPCRICVSILGIVLDGTLDGMLKSMLDGELDGTLYVMLVGIAECAEDVNAFFVCDKSSYELTCR